MLVATKDSAKAEQGSTGTVRQDGQELEMRPAAIPWTVTQQAFRLAHGHDESSFSAEFGAMGSPRVGDGTAFASPNR